MITIGRRLTARIAHITMMGSHLPLHARGAHTSLKASAMSRNALFFVPTTTMCPKRRPPRPKHPNFAHFHRSGLQFGHILPQHRAPLVRRARSAQLRCPWAVAGPGRTTSRGVEPHVNTQGPTGAEGAGGPGGHGRASRRGAERSEALASRAAGPSGARNTSGRANRPYSPPPPGSGRPV